MSLRKHQSGFSAAELVLILVVVGIIAVVGYVVYNRQPKTTTNVPAQASQVSDVSSAPTIATTSDLDKALQVLDQNNPGSANSSDTSQLNSQTSSF
jgi:Tfp pilus assembly protein FimT